MSSIGGTRQMEEGYVPIVPMTFLWLPLATCRYVQSTGDTGVLDESIHFIMAGPVNPREDSYYDLPLRSEETASLYEHCVRAISEVAGSANTAFLSSAPVTGTTE
jgi:cellobiose phosphorylase